MANVNTTATAPEKVDPSKQAASMIAEPASSAQPILSTVIKAFFDASQRHIEPDQQYNYFPQEDVPYPWNILRPVDTSLNEKLEKEYKDFKAAKRDEIDSRTDLRRTLAELGNSARI